MAMARSMQEVRRVAFAHKLTEVQKKALDVLGEFPSGQLACDTLFVVLQDRLGFADELLTNTGLRTPPSFAAFFADAFDLHHGNIITRRGAPGPAAASPLATPPRPAVGGTTSTPLAAASPALAGPPLQPPILPATPPHAAAPPPQQPPILPASPVPPLAAAARPAQPPILPAASPVAAAGPAEPPAPAAFQQLLDGLSGPPTSPSATSTSTGTGTNGHVAAPGLGMSTPTPAATTTAAPAPDPLIASPAVAAAPAPSQLPPATMADLLPIRQAAVGLLRGAPETELLAARFFELLYQRAPYARDLLTTLGLRKMKAFIAAFPSTFSVRSGECDDVISLHPATAPAPVPVTTSTKPGTTTAAAADLQELREVACDVLEGKPEMLASHFFSCLYDQFPRAKAILDAHGLRKVRALVEHFEPTFVLRLGAAGTGQDAIALRSAPNGTTPAASAAAAAAPAAAQATTTTPVHSAGATSMQQIRKAACSILKSHPQQKMIAAAFFIALYKKIPAAKDLLQLKGMRKAKAFVAYFQPAFSFRANPGNQDFISLRGDGAAQPAAPGTAQAQREEGVGVFLRDMAAQGSALPATREEMNTALAKCRAAHPGVKIVGTGQVLFIAKQTGVLEVHNNGSDVKWNRPRLRAKFGGAPGAAPAAPANEQPPATKPPATKAANPAATTTTTTISFTAPTTTTTLTYVKTPDGLRIAAARIAGLAATAEGRAVGGPSTSRVPVAVGCEGGPESLSLVQVACELGTFVFDCVLLGAEPVGAALQALLRSGHALVLMHNAHLPAVALRHAGVELADNVLDTQLVWELMNRELRITLAGLLKALELPPQALKAEVRRGVEGDAEFWGRRPLPRHSLEAAALNASLLLGAWPKLKAVLAEAPGVALDEARRASGVRVRAAAGNGGVQTVDFDDTDGMCSAEALPVLRPGFRRELPMLEVTSAELGEVLGLLPPQFLVGALAPGGALCAEAALNGLRELAVDLGEVPLAYIGEERRALLADGEFRTGEDDIAGIVAKLGGDARFGGDNRAGLPRSLHRISAMRNVQGVIYGLTLRIGRAYSGSVYMIRDLLFGAAGEGKSILILGEPGSGKTTVIREVARCLAEQHSVCIVDTSNEIAGDGNIKHPCVGMARRMMVPSLDRQHEVMVQCVQNHTPHVMVVDEIGRRREVDAAQTVKQRGVRMVASAHGDFNSLRQNPELRDLLGGVQQVIETGGVPKTKRTSAPIFDVIIETRHNAYQDWNVIPNVGRAVDRKLAGEQYIYQRRFRRDNGPILLELHRA